VIAEFMILSFLYFLLLFIVYNTIRETNGPLLSVASTLSTGLFPHLFLILYIYKFGEINKDKRPDLNILELVISLVVGGVVISPLLSSYITTNTYIILLCMQLLVPTTGLGVYILLFRIYKIEVPEAPQFSTTPLTSILFNS
jgi:uncharacterized membrane protein YoaK (UPF0700 family)